MRGKSQVHQLEDVIGKTEAQIAKEDEQARQHGVAADEAEGEKIAIASAEAKGSIDTAAARQRYEDADGKARRHRLEIERIGHVRALRERDLEGFRHELEHARYQTARQEWDEVESSANAVARDLQKHVRAGDRKAGELLELRAQAKDARARARELRPADVDDFDFVSSVDEPEWDKGLDDLRTVLEAGSSRPSAESAKRVAESEEQRRRSDESLIQNAVRYGGSMISRLPERLQEDARRRRAQAEEQEEARREAQTREAEADSELGSPREHREWARIRTR